MPSRHGRLCQRFLGRLQHSALHRRRFGARGRTAAERTTAAWAQLSNPNPKQNPTPNSTQLQREFDSLPRRGCGGLPKVAYFVTGTTIFRRIITKLFEAINIWIWPGERTVAVVDQNYQPLTGDHKALPPIITITNSYFPLQANSTIINYYVCQLLC